eukprot:TRINITY_DN616_c0_g1_i1.p1 TRINITY_DN616_c0_g1~~TRINITY_DN616_c0_g1_i1.p1  ORF type:complete len:850 (-),score=211.16 TRINITY_DN616_c0_g1_i1:115-2664(-)
MNVRNADSLDDERSSLDIEQTLNILDLADMEEVSSTANTSNANSPLFYERNEKNLNPIFSPIDHSPLNMFFEDIIFSDDENESFIEIEKNVEELPNGKGMDDVFLDIFESAKSGFHDEFILIKNDLANSGQLLNDKKRIDITERVKFMVDIYFSDSTTFFTQMDEFIKELTKYESSSDSELSAILARMLSSMNSLSKFFQLIHVKNIKAGSAEILKEESSPIHEPFQRPSSTGSVSIEFNSSGSVDSSLNTFDISDKPWDVVRNASLSKRSRKRTISGGLQSPLHTNPTPPPTDSGPLTVDDMMTYNDGGTISRAVSAFFSNPTPEEESMKIEIPDGDEAWILCRICDMYVPISQILLHTTECSQLNAANVQRYTINDRLSNLAGSAVNRARTHHEITTAHSLLTTIASLCNRVYRSNLSDSSLASVRAEINSLNARIQKAGSPDMTFVFCARLQFLVEEKANAVRNAAELTSTQNELTVSRVPKFSDFKKETIISRGAFGVVYLAKKKRTGDYYAMKVMKKQEIQRKNMSARMKSERDILMANNDSPYVVPLVWSFHNKDYLVLVMEYCPGGDLLGLLREMGQLPIEACRQYIAELFIALNWLHSRHTVHRDIKPDNVLIDEHGHLKLIDFGLSNKGLHTSSYPQTNKKQDNVVKPHQRQHSIVGTPDYLPPELLLGLGHDTSADYWSTGCLLYEMVVGVAPFNATTKEEVFNNIVNCKINWQLLEEEADCPEILDLLKGLLRMKPSERFTYKEVQNHPFFADIDWETVYISEPVFKPVLANPADTSYFENRRELRYPSMNPFEDFDEQQSFNDDYKGFSYINIDELRLKNEIAYKEALQNSFSTFEL